jgi:hypothetical protein
LPRRIVEEHMHLVVEGRELAEAVRRHKWQFN